jgi:hypothetical protein
MWIKLVGCGAGLLIVVGIMQCFWRRGWNKCDTFDSLGKKK